MKIEVFRGFANSYLIDGHFLIDATNLKTFPKGIDSILLTHEHCDHVTGIEDIDAKKIYANEFVAKTINDKEDGFCLCKPLNMDFPNKKITNIVKDGDIVEQENFALRIIETPGHSKGAICVYVEEEKILFSGDTIFPDFAMPRTDLPSSEPEKLLGTYEKLGRLDIEIVYPGHGEKIIERDYIRKLIGLL